MSIGRGGRGLEKVQHVFGGLLKVVVAGELGEGEFLWEEIDLEHVAFC